MLRRSSGLGLILVSVLVITVGAIGAMPVAPASARCFQVIANEVSSWGERGGFWETCKKEVAAGKNGFSKVVGTPVLVGASLCFKVQQATEESGFEDVNCATPLKSKGKWIKVKFEAGKGTEAEPLLSPEASEKSPIAFTSKGGAATLEAKGGTKVECKASEGKGSMTGLKLGTSEISFTSCASAGLKCTGLGLKEGVILVQGTLHLWYGMSKTEGLPVGSVLLLKELHFTCGGLVLIVLKGCLAGAVSPVRKVTKALTTTFKQEKGVNDITEVVNESNETIPCSLLASKNEGAFEQAGLQSSEEATKFKQGEKEIEVEVIS